MSRPQPFTRVQLESAPESMFSQSRAVRFQDVDAAGTVFFPRIIEYFADAYIGLLQDAGIDLPGILRAHTWVAPLVHAEADFLAPMRFGDVALVEVVASTVGRSSYAVGYRARSATGSTVLAVGHTAHVVVDGGTFRPLPVPDALRTALART